MKSFHTEIKEYAKKTRLLVSEKRALRDRIRSYMEYHPVRSATLVSIADSETETKIPFTDVFHMFHITRTHMRVFGGVCMIALVVTQLAAVRSVPGDTLYLVKTGVLEPLQGQLANTPYKKIEFETRLMERRIAEARELAREGKLTDEVTTQIVETVKNHTDAVQGELATLRTQDASQAALAEISFSASLEVQSAVLEATVETSTTSVDTIRTVVDDARTQVDGVGEEADVTFEAVMAQVETDTTRVYELLETIRQSSEQPEAYDIDRRLADINRLITEAEALNEHDHEAAVTHLKTTLGQLQKLIVFLSDIEIRESIALESIVPVVMSDEELVAAGNLFNQGVVSFLTRIASTTAAYPSSDVVRKIEEGAAHIETLLEELQTRSPVTDREARTPLIMNITELQKDIETLVSQLSITSISVPESAEDETFIDTIQATTTPVVEI